MNAKNLRGWLLQQPRPATVRLHCGDVERDLKPHRSYAKTAETIEAINPDLIEAFDTKGELLRACNLRDEEHAPTDVEVPPVLQQDPQAAMLMLFGRLLARAYEHSQDVAFTKLVELTDKMGDRADAIERRLERSEATARRDWKDRVDAEHELELAEAQAEAERAKDDNFGERLLSSFAGGQQHAAAPKAPLNGKGQA